MKNIFLLAIFSMVLLMSCGSSDSITDPSFDNSGDDNSGNGDVDSNVWLIPISQVRDGGPGRDGIPSIDNPKFLSVSEAQDLVPEESRVVGIKIGNEVKAYPHFILDWHESVNDEIGNKSVAITYCPLTGTGIGWNRVVNGNKTTFGVSGLLYNNNLILFDRSTNSNWSQILLQSVNGSLIGQEPEIIKVVETNWITWKTMYPETKILSRDTGFSRTYDVYPYGDYRTNNDRLIFPLSRDDKRLPRKERVHAIIDNQESRVYEFNSFAGNNIIRDVYNGKEILLVGDQSIIVSFELDSEMSLLEFEYVFNGSEVFFKDNEGTEWDIFGEALTGQRTGNKLTATISFMAYWFSIGAIYPNAEIYKNE